MTEQEFELYHREIQRLTERHEREEHRTACRRAWDKRCYRTVSCRVPIETAQRFAKLCARHGKTPYRALKDAIEGALRDGGG